MLLNRGTSPFLRHFKCKMLLYDAYIENSLKYYKLHITYLICGPTYFHFGETIDINAAPPDEDPKIQSSSE